MLSLENISKSYKKGRESVQALQGVSLEIKLGKLIAVKGPSGSGKTTLLLIAGGLMGPDSGVVSVDGVNPYTLGANERSLLRFRKIGFVYQQFHLLPFLDAKDNVLTPLLAGRIPSGRQKAELLLDRFGLKDRMDHRPNALSTGEKQRVALARALLNDPPVILADEPTGNLDDENSHLIISQLRDSASKGCAVLIASHDERVLSRADEIVVLERGRVVS